MYVDVVIMWHCMPLVCIPIYLCNVDVMISTLQKRLQDALLSLVGPSSSFWIGSHIGRDTWGLDAPMKLAPTLEVRKGNARYRRG